MSRRKPTKSKVIKIVGSDKNAILDLPETICEQLAEVKKASYYMQEIYRAAWEKHDRELRKYLTKNLKEFGYNIETDEDLNKFAKERIEMHSHPNHENEIFIKNTDGTRTLIGIFSTKVSVEHTGNTLKINIG